MRREQGRQGTWSGWRAGPLVLALALHLVLGLALHFAPNRAFQLSPGLAASADATGDVPGSDAVFAGRGAAIVWGVLRGADAAASTVVIWIASRDPGIRAVSVSLLDAAGGQRLEILPPSLIGKTREARASRARFATHPRTEIRFAATTDALVSGASAFTISYTGIPETTPELPNEDALAGYLESALARAAAR
jgi:hypothetical protein